MDYELDLLKKMQGMKQVGKNNVQDYIEEFYQVRISINHVEADKEKFFHYLNDLWPSIQDEMSLV